MGQPFDGISQKVAGAFLRRHYGSLKNHPRRMYRLYRDSSLLAWPGPDGDNLPVTTTLTRIKAKIMSSDYERCEVEIKTIDAQESLEGGFIVAVTGLLTRKDTVRESFNQTFVLVKQGNGVFILNDILRVCNLCESKTSSAANDDEKSNQDAPSLQSSVPCNNSFGPASNADTVVQNGNAEETLDISVSKDIVAEVVSSAYSSVSSDTVDSDLASSSVSTDTILDSDAEVVSCAFTVSEESSATSQVVAPPTDRASETSTSSSSVAPKPPVARDARGVYINGLPCDITKQRVMEVVKRFGPVKSIRLEHEEDIFYGYILFKFAEHARHADEVCHVKFGEKEACIAQDENHTWPPRDVAYRFLKQYYCGLKRCPEESYRFYEESSLLTWPDPYSDFMIPVTTLSAINNKIMSSDYKWCDVEIETVDALDSLEGGLIFAVTGLLIRKDTFRKSFSQTFFLARQEGGYFVANDILRVCNLFGSINNSAANDDEKSNQAAPSVQSSVPCNDSFDPASNTKAVVQIAHVSDAPTSNTDTVVQNGNAEETLDISVPKDSDAEVVSSASSSVSSDTVCSVLAPSPNVEEKAQKVTYASVVENLSSAATKTAKVPPNADSQVVAPSTNKASVPRGDFASKASAPSSNVAPKLPTGSNDAPNGSSNAEARGVHIGGLPSDITKQGVMEVVTKFGPVRSLDSIQLVGQKTVHCYGFVEFKFADAARHAVEARRVKFGEKVAYINWKTSSFNGVLVAIIHVMMVEEGLQQGGYQNDNSRGRENTGYDIGPRHSRPSDESSTEESGWRSK